MSLPSSFADTSTQEATGAGIARQFGYDMTRFSVRERTPIVPGVPDYYFVNVGRGIRLWWEWKQGRDKLTKTQYDFIDRDLKADGLAGCGGPDELKRVLIMLTRSVSIPDARRVCREIVETWKAKGFRPESQ